MGRLLNRVDVARHATGAGLPVLAADARQHADVMRWRKAERERLIAGRLALDSGDRRAWSENIAARLEDLIGEVAGVTVSAYWPFR